MITHPSYPTSPPSVGTLPNVDYPFIAEKRLSNGLTVIALREDRLPRVSIRLGFPGGRLGNPSNSLAALQVGTDLLFEGTRKRTSRQLAEKLDRFAIQAETDIYMESCRFFFAVLDSYLKEAFQVLAEVLLQPSYDELELEKLKVRWTSFLISERAQPAILASEKTMAALFPNHPYSRVTIPLDHLKSLTREELVTVLERQMVPDNAYLLLAGPISLEDAVDLAESHLSAWAPDPDQTLEVPDVKEPETGQVLLVHRPYSVQSRFEVAGRGPARTAPDYLAFGLANQVLGGGASARLFLNLRENKGYTYGAYSLLRGYIRSGFYSAAADVRSEVIPDAIGQTLDELRRMREKEPEQSEVELARAELIGSFVARMETTTSIGGLEMDRRLGQLNEEYYRNYIPSLQQMTPATVLESSADYFDPERVVITVVGDADKLLCPLQSLGSVTVFDTQGRKLEG